LRVVFPGNAGNKAVRWVARYFMGYYTIWLALVKGKIVPFWELESHAPSTRMMRRRFGVPVLSCALCAVEGPRQDLRPQEPDPTPSHCPTRAVIPNPLAHPASGVRDLLMRQCSPLWSAAAGRRFNGVHPTPIQPQAQSRK